MIETKYILEKTDYGWLLCAPPFKKGVPTNALEEIAGIVDTNSLIDGGICHYYNETFDNKNVVWALGSPDNLVLWRNEIETILKNKSLEERWWYGVNVGKSSALIFSVLCTNSHLKVKATNFSHQNAVPYDSDDFDRCRLLLNMFPWRLRLNEVAEKYSGTKWPQIIAKWSELENASPQEQTKILRSI